MSHERPTLTVLRQGGAVVVISHETGGLAKVTVEIDGRQSVRHVDPDIANNYDSPAFAGIIGEMMKALTQRETQRSAVPDDVTPSSS
jgi:hypothetical protein